MSNKDLQLINLVERFPHLYDKKDTKYKDRLAVENSWFFISGELKIPIADCIARWTALRNRFSKERAKKIPSGSAVQTEWPLMKHLAFLNSVVKKRRTFGNITFNESNFSLKMQNSNEDNATDLTEEANDSMQYCTDYEYLDTDEISNDMFGTEESVQSLSDVTEPTSSISAHDNQYITEASTSKISTPKRDMSHTSTEKSISSNTFTTKRVGQKRKQSSNVEEQLGNAVDVFKSFVTHNQKNTVNAGNEALKNFCDSLYGDLKNLDKKDLLACKIDIMKIISTYTNK